MFVLRVALLATLAICQVANAGKVPGANAEKVRLCLSDSKALEKCQALGDALRLENADSEFECTTDKDCVKVVASGAADATIVDSHEHPSALKQLEAVLFESYDDENLIVALIDAGKESKIQDLPLAFDDKHDLRLLHAASYINLHRNGGSCTKVNRTGAGGSIKLERYHEVKNEKNQKLVCIDEDKLVTKPLSEFKNCHVESNIPNAVMVKKGSASKNEIRKAFETAAEKSGRGVQFQLFGPFKGQKDLIFSDETKTLVPTHSEPNDIDVEAFLKLHCGDLENHDHAHDGHDHSHHGHDHHDHDHDDHDHHDHDHDDHDHHDHDHHDHDHHDHDHHDPESLVSIRK